MEEGAAGDGEDVNEKRLNSNALFVYGIYSGITV